MEKNMYKSLVGYVRPYKFRVAIIVILKITTVALSVLIPFLMGEVISLLESGGATTELLLRYLAVILAVFFAWDAFATIVEVQFEYVNKAIENDVRTYCYDAIINSKMASIQEQQDGEIISRIIRDTEKIEKLFSNIVNFAEVFLHLLGIIIMMVVVDLTLTSIVFGIFVVIVIIQRITSKPLKRYYRLSKDSEESLVTELKNYLAGFLSIKVMSIENRSIALLQEKNKTNLNNHMKIKTTASLIKYTNFFLAAVFRVSTVIFGGILFLNGRITIGAIFALHSYAIQLMNRVRTLIEVDILLKDIEISFARVNEFLASLVVNDESGIEIDEITEVCFDNVSYGYGQKLLYENLSFKASKGQIFGIKGGNGTGKTTLTYLICGFYDVEGVYVNGSPVNDFSEKELLRRISYALQKVYLFPGTILENLSCFGLVDEDKVHSLAKQVGLDDKIQRLSDGYNTVVNEKNLNLSGGEKQLISLVQALLKDSDIIILDEVNSALDKTTEEKLFQNITPFLRDRIVFIISHRKEIYDMCDYIIDLDNGIVRDNTASAPGFYDS